MKTDVDDNYTWNYPFVSLADIKATSGLYICIDAAFAKALETTSTCTDNAPICLDYCGVRYTFTLSEFTEKLGIKSTLYDEEQTA